MEGNNISTGIVGLTFIALFVGKIFAIGQIAGWSWWWVTAPLWGPVVLKVALGLALALVHDVFTITGRLFR